MDLALYGRVLWRFRLLVALGLVLAVGLAVVSVAKISTHGLAYRKSEIWQSQTTLMLTQNGFPWGRALFPPAKQGKTYPYADEGRFANLTGLYSQFAGSDAVKAIMASEGAPQTEAIGAAPVQGSSSNALMPLMALYGKGASPAQAVEATQLGTKAFLTFLDQQAKTADIPPSQRIDIRVLQSATPPIVIQPRKKTLPIIVFITVLTAAIALAFVLENLRPRVRTLPKAADGPAPLTDARRTA